MHDNPFHDELFPNSQSKPLMVQHEVDSFCLVTWKKRLTSPYYSLLSGNCRVIKSPGPHFLQGKQPQLPQALLKTKLLSVETNCYETMCSTKKK